MLHDLLSVGNATGYYEEFQNSKFYPHEGNSSITTSVTIHVTPQHYYLLNWAILWGGFIFAITFAAYQVWLDHQWYLAVISNRVSSSRDGSNSGKNLDHSRHSQFNNSKFSSSSSRRRNSNDIERGNNSDGETVISSADATRNQFRKLLLLAMITRALMIPVQMWSDPLWAQFVADTLPEMTFSSAWTLLVSFFVQLVGVAQGTGTSTSTGMVIQATAYVVYGTLVATYCFGKKEASVLLYALLCCIYAALFGTSLYFCPRLVTLLAPSLKERSQMGLALRLLLCSVLCVFVFGGRTVGFARKVVAPPKHVSWWWQYGALELVPSIIFLIVMHPSHTRRRANSNSNTTSSGQQQRSTTTTTTTSTTATSNTTAGLKRTGLSSSQQQQQATQQQRSSETMPLKQSQVSSTHKTQLYGSTAATTGVDSIP